MAVYHVLLMIIGFSAKYLSLELFLKVKKGREKRILSASIDRLACNYRSYTRPVRGKGPGEHS